MKSRRSFFTQTAALAAAGLAPLRLAPQAGRRQQAYRLKVDAAVYQRDHAWANNLTNGDEQAYPNHIASFTKTLPHNQLGEVDSKAYAQLTRALDSGLDDDFAAIPLGGTVKLQDPQAAFCFDLFGADSHQLALPPPPAFASAEIAGEITELYWQALTRDVPFAEYGTNSLVGQALDDLNRLSDFRGPKVNSRVTAGTLFRGLTPGDMKGPYVSQFLAKPIPFGAAQVVQQYRVPQSGLDYMTVFNEWLSVENGIPTGKVFTVDATSRYVRNGRDLAWWVHQDFSYQAYLSAALLLLSYGAPALSPGNYYLKTPTEGGFVTFGAPDILDVVTHVANAALRAAWCQKWHLHMRLRPEVFGARIHQVMVGNANYPIHSDALNAQALKAVYSNTGSYLLPIAYPEGSPAHPSYPAGHAAIAGACVTVLKAFFNESFAIPAPVVASADGTALQPYDGTLTVGDELNKLAANIALARDTAGVHYRSDGIDGLNLGESVTVGMLHDIALTYHEDFSGFTFTRFDGSTRTICPNC